MFAAVFVTVKSIQKEIADHTFTFGDLFSNKQFFTLIVSLASTYVMWLVASLIFFDPWHMFTSVSFSPSPQYPKRRWMLLTLSSLYNTSC